jgi:hypothetical protein
VQLGGVAYMIPSELQPDMLGLFEAKYKILRDGGPGTPAIFPYISHYPNRYCQGPDDKPWPIKGFSITGAALKAWEISHKSSPKIDDVNFMAVNWSAYNFPLDLDGPGTSTNGPFVRWNYPKHFVLKTTDRPVDGEQVDLVCNPGIDSKHGIVDCRAYIQDNRHDRRFFDLKIDQDNLIQAENTLRAFGKFLSQLS